MSKKQEAVTMKTRLEDVRNRRVRLLRDLRNSMGSWKAGTQMYIVSKYRGWGLALEPDKAYVIRCVPSDAIALSDEQGVMSNEQ